MRKITLSRVMLFVSLLGSNFTLSQLRGGQTQIWEKADPTSRDAIKCKDEQLLNFHCGIKDKVIKKFIRYSKYNSYTLSLVHVAKDREIIWENSAKNMTLANYRYQSGEKSEVKLKEMPSIFSFTNSADRLFTKSDSLNIKFSDENLYELIYYPRRATEKELNNLHSYLSIKYGISLDKSKYYNSEGTVIWDPQKHKDHKYRLTGLGRDDGNELYQKQSTNLDDQVLTIGKHAISRTNAENSAPLNNNEFVLWSDDNKDLTLFQEGNFAKLNRNWNINFVGSQIKESDFSVRIQKAILNPESQPKIYWLFITDSSGELRKIQGIEIANFIFFNNVRFLKDEVTEDSAFFTFAVSPTKNEKQDSLVNTKKTINDSRIPIDLENIVLYPNPVKKDQNFTIRFTPMENLNVSIYDGGGRLVTVDKVDRNSNHYVNHLSVQGSYIINLIGSGKIIKTFKLIVE